MEKLLEVDDLTTRFYTTDGVVHAVNGVHFSVAPGETLGIVGESGSGKSVSMMSIVGLIPTPPGRVEKGEAIFNYPEQTDLLQLTDAQLRKVRGGQIGFIFQDPISSLNPLMTIGRQIAESMETHIAGLTNADAKNRAIELLERVGIPDAQRRYNEYPHQFSGGMRQRVMIAIAMACKPQLVIADEPTTALDVTVQAQIIELIKEFQEDMGMAVVWISHDLGVVAGLADRVMVMYGGTVVEAAPVDELFERPRHPYTIGLMGAIPDLEGGEHRLTSIEGKPPDLLQELALCPFAPRCPNAFDRCWSERPMPREVGRFHNVACFFDVETGQPHEESPHA